MGMAGAEGKEPVAVRYSPASRNDSRHKYKVDLHESDRRLVYSACMNCVNGGRDPLFTILLRYTLLSALFNHQLRVATS